MFSRIKSPLPTRKLAFLVHVKKVVSLPVINFHERFLHKKVGFFVQIKIKIYGL